LGKKYLYDELNREIESTLSYSLNFPPLYFYPSMIIAQLLTTKAKNNHSYPLNMHQKTLPKLMVKIPYKLFSPIGEVLPPLT